MPRDRLRLNDLRFFGPLETTSVRRRKFSLSVASSAQRTRIVCVRKRSRAPESRSPELFGALAGSMDRLTCGSRGENKPAEARAAAGCASTSLKRRVNPLHVLAMAVATDRAAVAAKGPWVHGWAPPQSRSQKHGGFGKSNDLHSPNCAQSSFACISALDLKFQLDCSEPDSGDRQFLADGRNSHDLVERQM